jgi:hypothetical protein
VTVLAVSKTFAFGFRVFRWEKLLLMTTLAIPGIYRIATRNVGGAKRAYGESQNEYAQP